MFYVYALKSEKDGRLYIGLSSNPERRLKEHNDGKTHSTRSRRPFKIIYCENLPNRQLARKKELYLKSGIGREFFKSINQ
ncbi:MAG: GIY-YIG nuclease family protein [Patescibacteria group bacterium]